MLTAAELTAMQVVEESVQSSTAVIERYSLTADGMGGYSEAWSAVGTVTCDLWQVTRTDREKAGNGAQPIARGDWYITIPYDADVQAQDRITVDSRTFEVTFVPNSNSWLTALRCEAKSYNEEYRDA